MILKLETRSLNRVTHILVPIENIDCAVEEEQSIWIHGTVFYLTNDSFKEAMQAIEIHYTGGY
jgi:hypothetical protein